MTSKFAPQALRRFAEQAFIHRGTDARHAATIADALVWAELRGIESHGLVRLAQYLRHLDDGDMNAKPQLRTVSEAPAMVLIEADKAAGPVAMSAALEEAIARARTCAIAIALARRTTHTAALGYYTSRAAEQGFVAMAMSGAVPQMAYQGARGAAVSTSPFSIAVPAQPEPIVFDMASSIVGLGKLLQTARRGGTIEPGWATDDEGNPTTDPAKASVPLPMGGPKGSGLALMIELLTGVLAGNPVIAESLEAKQWPHRQNGLVIVIDVAKFGSLQSFQHEASRLARVVKSLPPSDPSQPVRIPGERGAESARKKNASGITLAPPVLKALQDIASKTGIPLPT